MNQNLTSPKLMEAYTILSFENQVEWSQVPVLRIDSFPWYLEGKTQSTEVRLASTKDALCLKVYCEDQWSYAEERELNGSVHKDSCFEFFFSPRDEQGSPYLNLEINCCGVLHLAYGEEREDRRLCTEEQAKQVSITSSIQGTSKEESPDDKFWTLDIEVPFELISQMAEEETLNLDNWYGNFYRCGGQREAQYGSWSPIESEKPDFHRPEFFGKLTFSQPADLK